MYFTHCTANKSFSHIHTLSVFSSYHTNILFLGHHASLHSEWSLDSHLYLGKRPSHPLGVAFLELGRQGGPPRWIRPVTEDRPL